jgi:DNA-binding GntR family transcriptional regulator
VDISFQTDAPRERKDAAAAGDRASAIVRSIEAAIVGQRLPPGAKLPEDELGAAFGVSRTIVRAALRMLAQDRVVTLAPNRGAFVSSPTVEEARQVFHARRVVEDALVREAAARCDEADLDRLRSHLDAERDALRRGDRSAAIGLSGEFHLLVGSISGQKVLVTFLRELISRSALVIALFGTTRESSCGSHDHAEVVEALARRDGEAAAAVMADHLRHIEHDVELSGEARPSVRLADVLADLRR